ncbi:MAG: choice-of-anchor tandem repeat NxxGxxAF-containing protein [Phycisphaerales bacterium]
MMRNSSSVSRSRMNPGRCTVVSAALALALAAGAAHASDLRVQTVIVSGMPAPGLTATFDFFSDPRLASPAVAGGAPVITFWADLAGAGITEVNNGSIWSNRAGPLAIVVREGDPSPIAGINWAAFPGPAASTFPGDGTRIGFMAALVDPLTPTAPINTGIFLEASPGGGFVLAARDGDQIPGNPPGVNFSGLNAGPFTGSFMFTSNKSSILWQADPGFLGSGTFSGQPAPGASGQMFGALTMSRNRPAETTAFHSTLIPLGSPTAQPTGAGIWRRVTPSPSILAVAITGQSIFATDPIKYKEVSAHPVSTGAPSGGTPFTAYWASMMEGGVSAATDTGLFVSGTSQALTPRVREGNIAPGVGPGIFFSSFTRNPSIGLFPGVTGPAPYFLAFRASIVGEGVSNLNNTGVWVVRGTSGSNPALIAREGDQVPRLPAGVLYASFGDPVVNGHGQVVFLARLRGPGVTQQNSLVLMATERAQFSVSAPAGKAAPIVRTGDAFTVAVGDVRTVDEILFDSQPDRSGATQLTDDGMFLFKLNFRDPMVPPPPPPTYPFAFTSGLFTGTIRCLADINADGGLTVADFGAFQSNYVLTNLRTCDFSGDGTLSVADFGSFQGAFVTGCPQ